MPATQLLLKLCPSLHRTLCVLPPSPTMSSTTAPADDLETRCLTTPIGWTNPPEYSPSSSSSSSSPGRIDSTPEYSTDLLPDETFLAGSPLVSRRAGAAVPTPPTASRRPSPYNYPYKSLTLSLNSRSTNTQSPAYGYAETMTGYVEVRGGMKPVEKVQLTVRFPTIPRSIMF